MVMMVVRLKFRWVSSRPSRAVGSFHRLSGIDAERACHKTLLVSESTFQTTDTDETMRRWDETNLHRFCIGDGIAWWRTCTCRSDARNWRKEREPDDEYKDIPLFNQLLVFMIWIRNWPADKLHVLPWRILVRHLPFRLKGTVMAIPASLLNVTKSQKSEKICLFVSVVV